MLEKALPPIRISTRTDENLRNLAREMGVPLSSVVRTLLLRGLVVVQAEREEKKRGGTAEYSRTVGYEEEG